MLRLLYIIYVVLAASASAQVLVIGRVIDLQNKPMSDVIVKQVSGSKTLALTNSNAQSMYNLEAKNVSSSEVTLKPDEGERNGVWGWNDQRIRIK